MLRTELRLPDITADFAKTEAERQGLSLNAFITNILTELRVYTEVNRRWELRTKKITRRTVNESLKRLRRKNLPVVKGDQIL